MSDKQLTHCDICCEYITQCKCKPGHVGDMISSEEAYAKKNRYGETPNWHFDSKEHKGTITVKCSCGSTIVYSFEECPQIISDKCGGGGGK